MVGHWIRSFHGGDDGEDDADDANDGNERDADTGDTADEGVDDDGDVEVECFAGVVGDLLRLVFFHEVDDERDNDADA